MKIWVDADACPKVIKDILFRAAQRVRVQLTLVANRHLDTPPSPFIKSIQVPGGFDVADHRIVQLMQPGDLVVTADIPLAALVVGKGGLALDPRGDLYTESNIGERVAVRDLMDQLRSTGEITGGPAAIGKRDRQKFADQLDRLLTKHVRNGAR
jgi:uncharacterized protein YaiI (UPF0178 family)